MFDPGRSLLAGRPTAQLQADLTRAQDAYIALSTGQQGVSFSYTQGDGTKSVTYTQANLGALAALIQLLQAQLGIVCHPRRAMVPYFTR